jgi:hypothetical protein
MQSVKILNTEEVQELRRRLTDLSLADAASFADGGSVNTEVDKEGDRVFENFHFCGFSVCRIKFMKIDYKANRPYATSALAKRNKVKMEAQVAPAPSLELVQWGMAKVLHSKRGDIGGKGEQCWSTLRTEAQKHLWLNRNNRDADVAEMTKGASDKAFLSYLADVKKNSKKVSKDDFQWFEALKVAERDHTICRPILGKDIVHIVDKNHKMVAFVFARALQTLFPPRAEEKMEETFDNWSHYHALSKPDRRHPLHEADFLPRNPQFDIQRARNPHRAKAYVEHYGIHAPIGHTDGSLITKTAGHRMDLHMRNEFPTILYPKLCQGGFRVSTETVNFFFKQLCPEDFEEYAEICRLSDQDLMLHTEAEVETFPLRALLGNVATQDHTDESDAPYGVAGIVTFGEFEGETREWF